MRRILVLLLLCAVAVPAQEALPGLPKKILRALGIDPGPARQGDRAYRRGNHEEAVRRYAEANDENPRPAHAFNAGNALYRLGRYQDAILAYRQALQAGMDDTGFAARAHYNLGNAHFRKGEASAPSARGEAIADLREALAHYKQSLQKNPGNPDAKKNLEFAQVRLRELLEREEQSPPPQGSPRKPPEPSAQAKEALARALQLAQERRYPEAKAVLEDILRRDPTAAAFQAHLQRLEDVLRILDGGRPAPPAPRDPRALQKGLGI